MTRSLSQTCYTCLMLTSKMVFMISGASLIFTLIASSLFNDQQVDMLTKMIQYMTKLVFYISISIGAFMLGKASDRINRQKQQEQHAAVLQTATRRRLSHRSPTIYRQATAAQQATAARQATAAQAPTTPPTTLSLDTRQDSPPKRKSTRRIRGRATRLEFESPTAPVPLARRLSMETDETHEWSM